VEPLAFSSDATDHKCSHPNRELEMNWFRALFGIAIALAGHEAFAKQRITDPIKIARECKSDLERLCKGLRPGRQRIISCLKEKVTELSPACAVALESTE
jgi:hypothetical protein